MTPGGDRWERLVTRLASGGGGLTVTGMCLAAPDLLGVSGAGIVLMGAGGIPASSHASGPVAGRLEELQFALGLGPGPEVHRSGLQVTEPDLAAVREGRWGDFPRAAVLLGVCAVSAHPLQVGAARLGTLTLYQDRPGPLAFEAAADAVVFAAVVTRAVLGLQAGADEGTLAEELSAGEIDHAEVHQASGMLSVQLGIGVGEALARLRARAFAEGSTVRSVALDIIAGRLRLQP